MPVLAVAQVGEAVRTASSAASVSVSAAWLSPPVVVACAGVVMNVLLAAIAVLALRAWVKEKNFTIARNLFISLFELDREARALKDWLMLRTLRCLGALRDGTALPPTDVQARFERLFAKAWSFQSALVEASGRWKTAFGLPTVGVFSTAGIEYSLTKIAEVLGVVGREEGCLGTSPPDVREKRASELAKQCMQSVGKCEKVLDQEWERFHTALDPLFEKHFSIPSIKQRENGEERGA